jgi:hypothetical protein
MSPRHLCLSFLLVFALYLYLTLFLESDGAVAGAAPAAGRVGAEQEGAEVAAPLLVGTP